MDSVRLVVHSAGVMRAIVSSRPTRAIAETKRGWVSSPVAVVAFALASIVAQSACSTDHASTEPNTENSVVESSSKPAAKASHGSRLIDSNARATSASTLTPELAAVARASDRLVWGTVVEVLAVASGPAGQPGIHSRVTLRLDGAAPQTSERYASFYIQGGELSGRLRRLSHQATFSSGEHTAVFLFTDPHGAAWPAGMERGKLAIQDECTPSACTLTAHDGSSIELASFSGVTLARLPGVTLARTPGQRGEMKAGGAR